MAAEDLRRWNINAYLTPMTDTELSWGQEREDPWCCSYPRRLAAAVKDAVLKARIPKLERDIEITLTWVFPSCPKRGRLMTRSCAAVLEGIKHADIAARANVSIVAYNASFINPRDPRVAITIQECEGVPRSDFADSL